MYVYNQSSNQSDPIQRSVAKSKNTKNKQLELYRNEYINYKSQIAWPTGAKEANNNIFIIR